MDKWQHAARRLTMHMHIVKARIRLLVVSTSHGAHTSKMVQTWPVFNPVAFSIHGLFGYVLYDL